MVKELIKSLIPMIKNVMDAINLRTTSGKKLEIEPPVKAPSKLAKTRAEEDPRKTANGLFEALLYGIMQLQKKIRNKGSLER